MGPSLLAVLHVISMVSLPLSYVLFVVIVIAVVILLVLAMDTHCFQLVFVAATDTDEFIVVAIKIVYHSRTCM